MQKKSLLLPFLAVVFIQCHGSLSSKYCSNNVNFGVSAFNINLISSRLVSQRTSVALIKSQRTDRDATKADESFQLILSPTGSSTSAENHTSLQKAKKKRQMSIANRRAWISNSIQNVAAATAVLATATNAPAYAIAATSEIVATTETALTCDATVSVWQKHNGRKIYLLGTAHISDVSAVLAGALVRQVHPEAVFVELDLKRISNLPPTLTGNNVGNDGETSTQRASILVPSASTSTSTASTTFIEPSTESPMPSSSRALSSLSPTTTSDENKNWFQRRALNFAGAAVGRVVQGMYSNLSSAGFQPGEEFAAAIRAGQEIGATIVLGDQDVQITLRRLAEALSVTDLNKLLNPDSQFEKTMADLLPLPPSVETNQMNEKSDTVQFKRDLSEYVERMKSRDTVRTIVGEFETVAPAVVRVMLTERDAYMANGLDGLESFPKVVAVMGLAHVDGVENNLRVRGWTPVRLSCPKGR
jgi:TraB/PrgY/gumN family